MRTKGHNVSSGADMLPTVLSVNRPSAVPSQPTTFFQLLRTNYGFRGGFISFDAFNYPSFDRKRIEKASKGKEGICS